MKLTVTGKPVSAKDAIDKGGTFMTEQCWRFSSFPMIQTTIEGWTGIEL